MLSSLEALFKKNCELLGKLRVELNDFSDGLDSLRELACRADSKLKYAFGSNYVGASDSGSPYGTPAQETPQPSPAAPDLPVLRETSVDRDTSVSLRDTSVTSWRDTSVSQETRDASMTPGADQLPHDPYRERKGRQTSEITRGDLSTPLQLKNIRRTVSMDDIVLTEEDEMDLKPMDEVVCFLDLDKCTIYGQDGNDLAIAMQWMGRPGSSVVELYRRLMNPQIKPLMKQLHRSTKRTPVVLYTMRPQLLQYRSAARNSRVNLRWKKEWHHSPDQVVIPPEIKDPEEIVAAYDGITPLLEGEKQDLFMSFQRLLCIRQVVQEELELDYTPQVVVTSTMKDVQATAQKLGLRPERSYLWDDNTVLEGQPHVLTVDPYVAMDPPCRDRLLNFLQEELPADELREEVVDFMLGAKPDQRCVRVRDSGEGVEYYVNEQVSIPRFPIPELPVCYTRPRFTHHDGSAEAQEKATLRVHYNSNIVEFWSAAWRKMDSDQLAARQKWNEQLEMVW